jgi:hypothetical protein
MKSVPGLRSLVVPSTRGLRFRIQSLWFRSKKWSAPLQPSLSATADGTAAYYALCDRQSVIKLIDISL